MRAEERWEEFWEVEVREEIFLLKVYVDRYLMRNGDAPRGSGS